MANPGVETVQHGGDLPGIIRVAVPLNQLLLGQFLNIVKVPINVNPCKAGQDVMGENGGGPSPLAREGRRGAGSPIPTPSEIWANCSKTNSSTRVRQRCEERSIICQRSLLQEKRSFERVNSNLK